MKDMREITCPKTGETVNATGCVQLKEQGAPGCAGCREAARALARIAAELEQRR